MIHELIALSWLVAIAISFAIGCIFLALQRRRHRREWQAQKERHQQALQRANEDLLSGSLAVPPDLVEFTDAVQLSHAAEAFGYAWRKRRKRDES